MTDVITVDEAARMLSAELEDTVALLGGRLLGGGLQVDSIRVAVGQTGEVGEDESFLLAEGARGRAGWAVEVRVRHDPAVAAGRAGAGPEGRPAAASRRTPAESLGDRDCTILRGASTDAVAALRDLGLGTVAALASLPERRYDELVFPEVGLRLLDAWSRAQLLRLPLPPTPLGPLAGLTLADLAGSSPRRLRERGLPTATDGEAEHLARSLALLCAALDLRVLRRLTLDQVAPPAEPDRDQG